MGRVVVAVIMAMSVSIAVIMLMKKGGADKIEREANASYYEYQLGVLDVLEVDEPLDGLQKDAQAQSEKEYAVEESAKELSTCPTEGKVLG
jgi:hypothetical protein